jgi:hypothetical protein
LRRTGGEHHDVERPEALRGACEGGVGRGRTREIALDRDRFGRTGGDDFRAEWGERCRAACEQGESCALSREGAGDRLADEATRTGEQNIFVFQLQVHTV